MRTLNIFPQINLFSCKAVDCEGKAWLKSMVCSTSCGIRPALTLNNIADFEKAISVDKNLAMAYHGMASCYSNLAEFHQKHREDPMSKELEVEYIKLSMLNMVKARDLGDPQAEKVIDSLKAKGLFKEE